MIEARVRIAIAAGLRVLSVAVVIGVSSWLAIALTRPEGGVSVIWIASGLLVGILLTATPARWRTYIVAALVGNIVARFAFGDPVAEVMTHALASTFEACIVAYALRYWAGDASDPVKLPLVARVAPASTVVACAISGLIVAALAQVRGTGAFGETFAAWFAAHFLGIVIVATTFVVLRHRGPLLLARTALCWEFALTLGLIAATTLLVFSQSHYPLLFLIYPPLLLAAFRHHFEGVAAGIVVVVIISLGANTLGYGPLFLIAGASPLERVVFLQFFIATACLSVLPVVIVLSQRSRLQRALSDGEQRLRAITDNLPALVGHVDLEQKYLFANALLTAMCAPGGASIIGRSIREVRGEQAYSTIKPHIEAALRGQRTTFELEVEVNGKRRHYESTYVPDVAADGSVRGCYAMTFDVSERVIAQCELRRIAQHDSLTGLGNRNQFNDHFERVVGRYRRSGRPIALVCLDIDYFKHINDTFGHGVGDAVLCEFARRLESTVRHTDLAVRLGGDEFVVICEGIDGVDSLNVIGKKLVAMMQPAFSAEGIKLTVSASIGIAVAATAADAQNLVYAADQALYEAKAAGRNTYRIAVADHAAARRKRTQADKVDAVAI